MLSMRESPILYAARGQDQVCMCVLICDKCSRGRHGFPSILILNNMVNILSWFVQLGVEPKLGAAIDMSKYTPYDVLEPFSCASIGIIRT